MVIGKGIEILNLGLNGSQSSRHEMLAKWLDTIHRLRCFAHAAIISPVDF